MKISFEIEQKIKIKMQRVVKMMKKNRKAQNTYIRKKNNEEVKKNEIKQHFKCSFRSDSLYKYNKNKI